MRTKRFIRVILTLAFASSTGTVSAADLELKLLHDKPIYLIAEPIWIDILLINHGADTVVVPYPGPVLGLQKFVVVNNGTDTLPYIGDISTLTETPEHRLAPGDTLYGLFNLLDGYRYTKSGSVFFSRPLQGEVTVSSFYYNLVTSNTISLSIVEPLGVEKEAYTLLTEGTHHEYLVRSKDKLEELLARFPNSVYAPLACLCLTTSHDPEQNLKYGRVLWDRYQESGFASRGMRHYLGDSKGSERDAKLDSLISGDKPFRLKMIARSVRKGAEIHR
jgi:hypothetical protein